MARTGGYRYGMKQKAYWTLRNKEKLSESFAKAYDAEKYIKELYKKCLMQFSASYIEIMQPFFKDGVLDEAALNKAKTYNLSFAAKVKRLEDEITMFSVNLSNRQQNKILETLEEIYKYNVIETYKEFNKNPNGIALLHEKAVTKAVKTPFTADGREFSDRIWDNLNEMNHKLRASLSLSIAKGESIPKTVKEFKNIFGNTTYNTNRIIRTETMAVYSKAAAASYQDLGVKEMETLTEGEACEICQKYAGKRIKVAGARVGIELPPFHPFCKCCVIPIVQWKKE